MTLRETLFVIVALASLAACGTENRPNQPSATVPVFVGGETPSPTPNLALEETWTVTPSPSPRPSPTPLPPVSTPVRSASSGVERWRSLVSHIFPPEAVEPVLRLIQCESRGDPNAVGAAGELGLLQVHPDWHPDATTDPEGNLWAGYRISAGGVWWGAWDGPRPGRGYARAMGLETC